jgi:RNA polymerase sigma-70 factor (ECF subfamily)
MGSESALVAAAKRGEAGAFEALVNRYERRMYRLALNIMRHHEDAEDVVQNGFLRAYLRLDTFQGDSLFSTWLTRIVVNQALMKLRQRRHNVGSLDELLETEDGALPRQIVDWGPNPEQRYSQTELRKILGDVIGELSPIYRVVFQLRDVEEFSAEETAGMLGLSISAVKSRLLRARLELRERLNRYFRGPRPQWRRLQATA